VTALRIEGERRSAMGGVKNKGNGLPHFLPSVTYQVALLPLP
jgi:hypothetical protein